MRCLSNSGYPPPPPPGCCQWLNHALTSSASGREHRPVTKVLIVSWRQANGPPRRRCLGPRPRQGPSAKHWCTFWGQSTTARRTRRRACPGERALLAYHSRYFIFAVRGRLGASGCRLSQRPTALTLRGVREKGKGKGLCFGESAAVAESTADSAPKDPPQICVRAHRRRAAAQRL